MQRHGNDRERMLGGVAAGIGIALLARQIFRRRVTTDLRGQVVLITGGSRGLGLALAEAFVAEGAVPVICARNSDDLDDARQRLLRQGAADVLAVPCDVRDREQVERLVGTTLEHFGRLDIVVNNAGTIMVGPLESQTLADFEDGMATMFWGTVYPALAALPQMRRQGGGRIVNTTSIGGKVSVPHLLSYSAAKFAAVGFSEGLRAEVAKDGIDVLTVVPGLMRTGSHVNAIFKGRHEQEYTWFGLGASMPGLTISAEQAAREIVAAIKRGDAEVTLGLPAQLLAGFHGLFPGVTSDIMGLVNRLLPAPGGNRQRHLGRDSETAVTESFQTTHGQRAPQRYHPEEPPDRVLRETPRPVS
jgi:NAD(P)-dependent dehydrogenase (short-subunit alcohol dehydrogenase family)